MASQDRLSIVTTVPPQEGAPSHLIPRKRRFDELDRGHGTRSVRPRHRPFPVRIAASAIEQEVSSVGDVRSPRLQTIPEESPQDEKYRPILEQRQAGNYTVAYRPDSFAAVALKTQPVAGNRMERLRLTAHDNVVNIVDFFMGERTVIVAYEPMRVTLAEILASPARPLFEFEIATVCSEVQDYLGS